MKYSKIELKEMANDFLYHYNKIDQRADMLIGMMSSGLRMHPNLILHKITVLADTKV